MMAAPVLTFIATILSVESHVAIIDRGSDAGLRPGDSGRAFYVLIVGRDKREIRIDAGRLEILDVRDAAATLRVPPATTVRRGYSVELQVPGERLSPSVPALEAAVEPAAARVLPAPTVPIPGGSYQVGVDLAEARFYNQHPRFRIELEPFWIDLAPVTQQKLREVRPDPPTLDGAAGGLATGVAYQDAAEHCRRRGGRLPTELEWEVAAGTQTIRTTSQIYEWTASWYRPYPGNRFPEEEYGETFRVLRGSSEASDPDLRSRRFMAPSSSRQDVGFRCARSVKEGAD